MGEGYTKPAKTETRETGAIETVGCGATGAVADREMFPGVLDNVAYQGNFVVETFLSGRNGGFTISYGGLGLGLNDAKRDSKKRCQEHFHLHKNRSNPGSVT